MSPSPQIHAKISGPIVMIGFGKIGPEKRSNYALRETLLAARHKSPGGPTAVSTCGANPGMVSWFVKQALLDIGRDTNTPFEEPKSREGWGRLAQRLCIKGIHIA